MDSSISIPYTPPPPFSPSPSHAGKWISCGPSLYTISKILEVGIHFVRISTNYGLLGTNEVKINPSSTFYLVKCIPNLICFMRSCWIGLWLMLITASLPQSVLIGSSKLNLSSAKRTLIHRNSLMPNAKDHNSASALDIATLFCFFTFSCMWEVSGSSPEFVKMCSLIKNYKKKNLRLIFIHGWMQLIYISTTNKNWTNCLKK